MKEKDTKKRKRISVDLEKIETLHVIDRSEDLFILLDSSKLSGNIDREITIQFAKEDIHSDVQIRVVCEMKQRITLKVVIKAVHGIRNVSSSIDMRALILTPDATITFVPSLEIDEMDVSVDHRSTIGSLPDEWLLYLASRGFSKQGSEIFMKEVFLQM